MSEIIMPLEIEKLSALDEKDMEFGTAEEKRCEIGKPFLGRMDIAVNSITSFRRDPYKQNFKF